MSLQTSVACPGGNLHAKKQCKVPCTLHHSTYLPSPSLLVSLRAPATSPTYQSLQLTCGVVEHPVFFHSFVSRMLCPSPNMFPDETHLLWDAILPRARASHQWTTLLPLAVCATIHLSLLLKDGALP